MSGKFLWDLKGTRQAPYWRKGIQIGRCWFCLQLSGENRRAPYNFTFPFFIKSGALKKEKVWVLRSRPKLSKASYVNPQSPFVCTDIIQSLLSFSRFICPYFLPTCMSVYQVHVVCTKARRGHLGPLESESQTVWSVGAGTPTQACRRSRQCS